MPKLGDVMSVTWGDNTDAVAASLCCTLLGEVMAIIDPHASRSATAHGVKAAWVHKVLQDQLGERLEPRRLAKAISLLREYRKRGDAMA